MPVKKYSDPDFTGLPVWELTVKLRDSENTNVYVPGRLIIFRPDCEYTGAGSPLIETEKEMIISESRFGCLALHKGEQCIKTDKTVQPGYKIIPANKFQKLCEAELENADV